MLRKFMVYQWWLNKTHEGLRLIVVSAMVFEERERRKASSVLRRDFLEEAVLELILKYLDWSCVRVFVCARVQAREFTHTCT